MPIEFFDVIDDILETEVRKDDIWLTGFLEHSVHNNALFRRYVGDNSVKYVKSMPSPRYIKTNLPYDLLPKEIKTVKPKLIYMTRNPKDVYCSYYKFIKAAYDYNVGFKESAVLFCDGKMPMGCPIEHVLPFWNRRKEPNILFLTYEDLKADTAKVIKLVADFLEKPLNSNQMDQILDYVSLENMRSNPNVNLDWYFQTIKNGANGYSFIGDGIVGGWKNQLPPEIDKMFDGWIERKTKGTGLTFQFT
ncbi:sulfotransferase sult [Holotrichia oblita]|uniref:Sulfotransferase sult n=1 Tax=Holotrichia oblita TaxID=644536 RepID=A0ACB9SU46_HOLOL|nr:sulfotransferase sult [Holotrichia oblita]